MDQNAGGAGTWVEMAIVDDYLVWIPVRKKRMIGQRGPSDPSTTAIKKDGYRHRKR
jgi:hypothetical protein